MRCLSVLLLVGACAAGGTSTKRWPEHRKQGDARFVELERRADELEARVEALTKELKDARAELAKLAIPGVPAVTPPP